MESRKGLSAITPGTYILLLRLPRRATVRIGRLGPQLFERGYYAYAGSALSGLESRIRRHLRAEKANRWHIDYLREVATVEGIWVLPGPERLECRVAADLLGIPSAQSGPRGFGSSDCHCRTHLVHFRDRLPIDSMKHISGLRFLSVYPHPTTTSNDTTGSASRRAVRVSTRRPFGIARGTLPSSAQSLGVAEDAASPL
jgi:Uri superfamily endonuclease